MQPEAILVVDDDACVLDFCCSALEKEGYVVLRAASGEDALDLCRTQARIDLALVDLVMPGMNGIELVKRLETMEGGTRVALISGCCPEEVASLIGEEGSGYRIFWKPFDLRIFPQMVRNMLDTPQREIACAARM
jgi:CheY-like chemotaxis protein